EVVEGEGELIVADDAEVGVDDDALVVLVERRGGDARLGIAAARDALHLRQADESLDDRAGDGGTDQDIDVADGLAAAAQTATQLEPFDSRRLAQAVKE